MLLCGYRTARERGSCSSEAMGIIIPYGISFAVYQIILYRNIHSYCAANATIPPPGSRTPWNPHCNIIIILDFKWHKNWPSFLRVRACWTNHRQRVMPNWCGCAGAMSKIVYYAAHRIFYYEMACKQCVDNTATVREWNFECEIMIMAIAGHFMRYSVYGRIGHKE